MMLLIAAFGWVQTLQKSPEIRSRKIQEKYVQTQKATEKGKEESKYSLQTFKTNYAATIRATVKNNNSKTGSEEKKGTETKDRFEIKKADINILPVSYTEVNYPYIDFPLYIFIDNSGNAQYRAYIERTIKDVTEKGFIPVMQVMKNMKRGVEYEENAALVDPATELYGIIELEDAPENMTGTLVKEYGTKGTYYFINESGEKDYYVYGHYPNKESAFYIADKKGAMIPGTLPVTIME